MKANERSPESSLGAVASERTATVPPQTTAGLRLSDSEQSPAISGSQPAARTLREVPAEEYEIESEAGRGGTGIVYRARDVRLDRVVAIKELRWPEAEAAAQARFEREMRITARLQHPGIVPVHEVGRWPSGRTFYAMKLVEGRPLKQLIETATTLEARLGLLAHVIAVADTIAYAHGRGVIHRDLKPSNVIVGGYGEVVVIDWGLAKDMGRSAAPSVCDGVYRAVSDPHATKVGAILGTPAFMAPEQARGEEVDDRADVYALGAILYCVLGGQPPYVRGNAEELIAQVLALAPVPLLQREPRVPRELATIVDKAMARESRDRYSSAKQLAHDLKSFQQGQLVGAHAYSRRELISRWLRRHRAVALVIAAACLVLMTVAAGAYRSVVNERDRWRRERSVAVGRANELLLQRARASLVSDPTASLAALSAYPDDGPDWDDVQEIASEAAARGIARYIWRGYLAEVNDARFIADGRQIVSASDDGRLQVIDVASGAIVRQKAMGARGLIALSPGSRIAAIAAENGRILIVDLQHSGGTTILEGHDSLVNAVRFLPDDGALISAASDGQLRRWPDPLHQPRDSWLIAALDEPIVTIEALGADGDFVLGTRSGLVQIRDRTGKILREWRLGAAIVNLDASSVKGATDLACVTSDGEFWRFSSERHDGRLLRRVAEKGFGIVGFSRSGRELALAGADGEVWLYGPTASDGMRLTKDAGEIYSLAFSPDGRWLAAGGLRGVIDVWSLPELVRWQRIGHTAGVYTIAFAPDSASIVTGGDDKTMRLWPLSEPTPLVLRGPRDDIPHVLIDPAGRWVAGDNRDGSIYVWDLATRAVRRLGSHRYLAYGIALSRDATRIASASWDATARLWPLDGGSPVELVGHKGIVWDVTFSPGGKRIATAGADRTIRVWLPDGSAEMTLRGHDSEAITVVFVDDDTLVSSCEQGTIAVWDLPSRRARLLRGHTKDVWSLRIAPGRREIASASWDGTIRLWTLATGEVRLILRHDGPVRDVEFSPRGDSLASVSEDGTVRIWDTTTGQPLGVYRGHVQAVRRARFSPDGTFLVSAGSRGMLHIWRLSDGAYGIIQAHEGMVLDVALSADGNQIATASTDRTVRLWRLSDFKLIPHKPSALRGWMHASTHEAAQGLAQIRNELSH